MTTRRAEECEAVVAGGLHQSSARQWKLLLAIAELAGDDWAEQARAAAESLSREKREPSWLELLLQELWAVFVENEAQEHHQRAAGRAADGRPDLGVVRVRRRRGHRVTEREVAALLRKLHIRPRPVGKTADSRLSPPGLSRKRDFPAFPGSRSAHPLTRYAAEEGPSTPKKRRRAARARGERIERIVEGKIDGQNKIEKIRQSA